jgi:tetratricopeptide (TPR) repeat protein
MSTARVVAVLAILASAGLAAGPPTPDAYRAEVLSFNAITGNEATLGKLAELSKDQARAKNLVQAALELSREEPMRLGRNTTLLMAMAAEGQKQTDAAIHLYKLYGKMSGRLGSERGMASAYLGIIQANLDAGRNAEVEKVCKEFLALETEDDDPDSSGLERMKEAVFRRMIVAIARQGGLKRALKIVDDVIERDPKNWLQHALKAQVLREADQLEDAAKLYLELVEKVEKDERLEKDIREEWADEYRYTLSGLFVDMGDVDKAAEQLKALLARKPNDPTYNNDLGFIWADHGKNLEEAEKLIRRAIAEERKLRKKMNPGLTPRQDKDNPSYLDSLGWVLFKQGKAKEAKPHLLEAANDPEGHNLEILDHLGDVHLALGEKAEALAAYKKGLEYATNSKRDQKRKAEVEKKIKALEGK